MPRGINRGIFTCSPLQPLGVWGRLGWAVPVPSDSLALFQPPRRRQDTSERQDVPIRWATPTPCETRVEEPRPRPVIGMTVQSRGPRPSGSARCPRRFRRVADVMRGPSSTPEWMLDVAGSSMRRSPTALTASDWVRAPKPDRPTNRRVGRSGPATRAPMRRIPSGSTEMDLIPTDSVARILRSPLNLSSSS